MKTLLLNPPSFEMFDGGASSRYQATREIPSFWYPVWLAYSAGMIKDSRLLDAPSHDVTPEETIRIATEYEFLVLFTSTAGFKSDAKLAEAIKAANPTIRIAFVGPHVTVQPEQSLKATPAIDFVVRREFDYPVAEFAGGKKLEEIAGISFRKDGRIVHNPDRPQIEDLDALPFAVDVYKRDLDITRYNIPYLKHPFVAFYTSRGCPALCTFCLWPQTMSGHPWRTRGIPNVVEEVKRCLEYFPKAMKEAGCRLLIVGFESGDPEILKNIKKGATVEQARAFMKNCKKLGLVVHGDFQVGHPGETPETIERTIQFAMELDPETIQVSMSHPYPGTEFDAYLKKHNYAVDSVMTDEEGHQLPVFEYPGLSRKDIMHAVEQFYDRYYFRPHVIFRILRRAIFDANDRRRLYIEGKEFLKVRAQRKRFVRTQTTV